MSKTRDFYTVCTDVIEQKTSSIVLYNDDVNTFNHVIETLVKYCKHTPDQSYQCALLTHHKGRCQVKSDSIEELIPIHYALLESKLSSKIE